MIADPLFAAVEAALSRVSVAAVAAASIDALRAAMGEAGKAAGDGWLGNARALVLLRRREAADQVVAAAVTAAVRTQWPEATVTVAGGTVTVGRRPVASAELVAVDRVAEVIDGG